MAEGGDIPYGVPEQGDPEVLLYPGSAPISSPDDAKIVNCPQTGAIHYVDMPKIHEEIDKALAEIRVIVLRGQEGMGKTEQSLQHVRRTDGYTKVFYVIATSRIGMSFSFKEISVQMGLQPTDINPQTCVQRVCEYLRENSEDHILILDDCGDFSLVDDIRSYLLNDSGQAAFRLIITSKLYCPENALSFPFKTIEITGFVNENIRQYIRKAKIPMFDDGDFEKYADKVETLTKGSPFLLNFITKRIAACDEKLEEYIDLREFEKNFPPIIVKTFSDAALYSAPHVLMILTSMCSSSMGISIVELFKAMAKIEKNEDDEDSDLKKYHHVEGFIAASVIAQNLERRAAKPSVMRGKFKEIVPTSWLPVFVFEGERVKIPKIIQQSYQIWLIEHFHCNVCLIAIYLKFINFFFESEDCRKASDLESMYDRIYPLLEKSETPPPKLNIFQELVLRLVDEQMNLMQYNTAICELQFLEQIYTRSSNRDNMRVIYSKLAHVHMWSGNTEAAREAATKALECRDCNPYDQGLLHINLACIERETENFEQAFKEMEKAGRYMITDQTLRTGEITWNAEMGKQWSGQYFQLVANEESKEQIINAANESIKYYKNAAKLSQDQYNQKSWERNVIHSISMVFQRARFTKEITTIEPHEISNMIRHHTIAKIKQHAMSLYGPSKHEVGWFYSKVAWIKSLLTGKEKNGDHLLSREAVNITFEVFGLNHIKTANVLKIDGMVLIRKGNRDEGMKQLEKALAIYKKLNQRQRHKRLADEMKRC